jgi:hypothetical protein
MGINGSRTVEKVMETVMVKELKDKDLLPPGPRRAMLYLGNSKFEQKYKKLMKLRREKVEEEKQNKKLMQGLEDATDEVEVNDDDLKPDREQIFLRQYPGMSNYYRTNKELLMRNSHKPGFDIRYGNWLPPPCCSMVVNII